MAFEQLRARAYSALTNEEAEALAEVALGQVLELGALEGFTTMLLASRAAHVVSVDWHRGDPHAGHNDSLPKYLANARGLDNVTIVVGRFEGVLPLLRPRRFDLVFVDGYHAADDVARDAGYAASLVAPGGVLAFHDYGLFEVAAGMARAGVIPTRVVGTLALVYP